MHLSAGACLKEKESLTEAISSFATKVFVSLQKDKDIPIFLGQPSEEIRQAAIMLQQVTNVVAVGVENYSDSTLLSDIASSPDLVVVAPTFAKLRNYGQKVVDTFCKLV